MTLKFESIRLNQQAEYSKYFARCPQKTSDYSFANLWGWAQEYGLNWAWTDHLVWIKQTVPQIEYWAPVGPWNGIDWKKCLHEFSQRPIRFTRIPERLLQVLTESCGDRTALEEGSAI